ncbi:MAG: TPM domain-containing protein [Steroidobacterales bacterium]
MHWHTRMLFPNASLDAIERAVAQAEHSHQGQIRFAIETALTPLQVLRGVSAHERALEVFASLRVWDTERNNGVLIYVQLADRHVEIIADRGFRGRVSEAEWQAVCRLMEQYFRAREFHSGALAGVKAVGALLSAHFPSSPAGSADAGNELPDRPTLL